MDGSIVCIVLWFLWQLGYHGDIFSPAKQPGQLMWHRTPPTKVRNNGSDYCR